MKSSSDAPTSEQLLMAILAVLVADREERLSGAKDGRKTEVILNSAGLGVPAIAGLLNKSPDAVRKSIQRSR